MSELGRGVCLFLSVFPPYRVGWLSVWVCPGLWRSIWSESHLSDCKWTACPRDARQLSGLPRKRHAGSEGEGGQQFSRMKHHVPPYATSLLHCRSHKVHSRMFIWVKCWWFRIIYPWTDGESEIKESGPWLQSVSCGINAYIRGSFYTAHLLNMEKSGNGLVILFMNARRKVLLPWV